MSTETGVKTSLCVEEYLEWEEDEIYIKQNQFDKGEISKSEFCQFLLNRIDHHENVLQAQYKFHPGWLDENGSYKDS